MEVEVTTVKEMRPPRRKVETLSKEAKLEEKVVATEAPAEPAVEAPVTEVAAAEVAPEVAAPAEAKPKDTKKAFILDLLKAAPEGLTWNKIKEEMVNKYGVAPQKRAALYLLLRDLPYEKKVGEKRIVTYRLRSAS